LKRPVVAIDGPAGCGKSTVAKLVAEKLGYVYLDTGAMYRAAALAMKKNKIPAEDEAAIEEQVKKIDIEFKYGARDAGIYLDGENIEDEIRTEKAGMAASVYSRSPAIRERLVRLQRKMAENGGVIMEGRDIGTVVFPDAERKFFLDAKPAERARRRAQELKKRGMEVDENAILEEVIRRDKQDRERELAPLKPAPDSIIIDTTELDIGSVLKKVLELIDGDNPRAG